MSPDLSFINVELLWLRDLNFNSIISFVLMIAVCLLLKMFILHKDCGLESRSLFHLSDPGISADADTAF